MSSDAVEAPVTNETEWQRLELLLDHLLNVFDSLRARVAKAEERVQQLEAAMRNAASDSGEVDPVALANRVYLLEQENRFLARRLDGARASVKRISARLQFLEDDR